MGLMLFLALAAGAQAMPAPPANPPATEPEPRRPRVSATRAFAPSGDPGVLERTWRLDRMNGETVGPEVTLRLGNGGAATGSTGCNRYSAAYELNGPSLRIVPPLPRGNLVCAPAVVTLEARVRESLLRIQSWTITPMGTLSLELNGGGNLIVHAI